MYVPRTLLEEIAPWRRGLPMLFIHTPKCGGSFVGKSFHPHQKRCISLRAPDLAGHLIWREYRDRLTAMGLSIGDYKTFSVIRNPFSWHVSWYNYIRSPRKRKKQEYHQSGYYLEHEMFQKMSFSNYVDWLDNPDALRTETFDMGKQVSDWVLDEKENIAVDHILRQETLAQDLDDMACAYGIRIRLPSQPVNVSSYKKRYQDFYTSEDVDKIAARHQRDIRLFGYEF